MGIKKIDIIKLFSIVCFLLISHTIIQAEGSKKISDSSSPTSYPKPTINFSPLATVSGGEILFFEITDTKEGDLNNYQLLRDISFGQAPLAGNQKILNKNFITWTLKQNGITPQNDNIICPEKLVIKRNSTPLNWEALNKEIQKQIVSTSPHPPESLIIGDLSVSPNFFIPQGKTEFRINLRQTRNGLGNIPISADVIVDGRVVKKIPSVVKVDLKVLAPRVLRSILKGEQIMPGDFEFFESQYSLLPSGILTDQYQYQNLIAKKNLSPGEFLTINSVEHPYLIKQGQEVLMVIEKGAMKITAKGIANQRGRVGELIHIINPTSKKMVLGRVEEEGIVRVLF